MTRLTNEEKVCLVLSSLEVTPSKAQKAFTCCNGAGGLFKDCNLSNKTLVQLIGEKTVSKWAYAFNDNFVAALTSSLEKDETSFATFYSSGYPSKLKDISEPPLVLYYKGDIELANANSVAVIGTRKSTNYGKRVVDKFIPLIVESNLATVSGLATGIDTIVHEKTLEAGGKTIAVLGAGFKHIYPPENLSLSARVSRCGLLLSEYPPEGEVKSYNFPRRNRIVSALSQAVLVIEADIKSGVFSTVEHASEQGTDVYAVPGDIFAFASRGCNYLIVKSLAKPVTSPEQLLDDLRINYKVEKKKQIQLSIEEQLIAGVLRGGNAHINTLLEKTGMKISTLNFLLSNMELKGLIVKLSGNTYKSIEDN